MKTKPGQLGLRNGTLLIRSQIKINYLNFNCWELLVFGLKLPEELNWTKQEMVIWSRDKKVTKFSFQVIAFYQSSTRTYRKSRCSGIDPASILHDTGSFPLKAYHTTAFISRSILSFNFVAEGFEPITCCLSTARPTNQPTLAKLSLEKINKIEK